MKTLKLLLFLLLVKISVLFSQNDREYFNSEFNRANFYFPNIDSLKEFELNEKAKKAIPIYLELLKLEPNNTNLNYRLGVCYLNTRTMQSMALRYLEKTISNTSIYYNNDSPEEKKAPLIAYKFLGDAYHFNYQFDDAIKAYTAFIEESPSYTSHIEEATRKIEICKSAKILVSRPINVTIENLGNAINTTYPDYSPLISADESLILFTSRREGGTSKKTDENGYVYEDIYFSKKDSTNKWTNAKNIGSPLNTDGNEAALAISANGKELLIYKDYKGDGNIFSASLIEGKWSKPEKLNSEINTKYWETSASISPDGKTLYFTSDRPGGFGGRDIYKSVKNANGEWEKAVNLGSLINTPYEEDAPFIHTDGVTLYFSSTGYNTMGGFDIFSSKNKGNDTIWTTPSNIGYPINTTDDDIYFVISPDKKRGYFSSFRSEGIGEKDIYMAKFTDTSGCSPIAIYKGEVKDANGNILKDVEIKVTDLSKGETVGIFHPNNSTGNFLISLPIGKNYSIYFSSKGYIFGSINKNLTDTCLRSKDLYYSEKLEPFNFLNKDTTKKINIPYDAINLKPIAIGSKIVLNNIFFDFDNATLRDISKIELDKLYVFLTENPNVNVLISGHTDTKGDYEKNITLSENRAKQVQKYLTEKGIKKRKLQIKGYGPLKPIAPNKNKDGSDNPQGRQLNRRVEFKIIGM